MSRPYVNNNFNVSWTISKIKQRKKHFGMKPLKDKNEIEIVYTDMKIIKHVGDQFLVVAGIKNFIKYIMNP